MRSAHGPSGEEFQQLLRDPGLISYYYCFSSDRAMAQHHRECWYLALYWVPIGRVQVLPLRFPSGRDRFRLLASVCCPMVDLVRQRRRQGSQSCDDTALQLACIGRAVDRLSLERNSSAGWLREFRDGTEGGDCIDPYDHVRLCFGDRWGDDNDADGTVRHLAARLRGDVFRVALGGGDPSRLRHLLLDDLWSIVCSFFAGEKAAPCDCVVDPRLVARPGRERSRVGRRCESTSRGGTHSVLC